MISREMLKQAQDNIRRNWGNTVVDQCLKSEPLHMSGKEFLDHCLTCGGNWGGMLLSGVRKMRPEIYDTIPDEMGDHAWECICDTLLLLDVDTTI